MSQMQGEDGLTISTAGSGAEAQLAPPGPRKSPSAAAGKGPVRWEVIGGTKDGGIIVRDGQQIISTRLRDRLATGAIIEQQRLVGDRLHFKKVSGQGPAHGWVSVTVSGKRILSQLQGEAKNDTVADANAQADAEAHGKEWSATQASKLVAGDLSSQQPKAPDTKASERNSQEGRLDLVPFTLERALSLQKELIEGFSQPEVQQELNALAAESPSRTTQLQKKQAELYFKVQRAVLPKYGFEATRIGIIDMMKALQSHQGPQVTENDELLNTLLRL